MPSSQEIARVMAEMDRFNKSVTVTEERYEKRVASVGGSYGGLTALLQQGAPGNWASDHKSEAEKFAGWHYVAITSIGKAVRSSDVEAYQENVREYAKGYNEQDEDTTPLPKWHPLMKLLKRPNPSQSGASFREEMAIQLCLTGSALVWNVPNQMGRTVERYVIPTAIAEPRQPEKGLPKGGWYINPEVARWQIESGWFLYTGLATAIGKVIDARDVQVVRFIHPVFKDEGQSPVSAGALWTDTSEKIDISRHAHLRNGSDPSVIIGIDGVEDEGTLQRMSAKFNEKYAGPSKHGKAMFVNGQNVKVEPVTRTPAEMAYEGAFAQFRDAIMALHGVTPIAAGIEAPSGDDGLYAPLKQFVVGTVQPILDLMAEEDTEQLASQFGEGVSILYTARAIDDAKLTEQQINTDIAAGAIEVDEIRKLRGRKPWGGEKGKAVAGQGAKEEPKPGLPGLAQGVPGLEPQTGSQALDPSKPAQGMPDPMKLAEEAVAKALGGFADRLSALLKSGDNCGTGAGGFKPGNDCAGGGEGGNTEDEYKDRLFRVGKKIRNREQVSEAELSSLNPDDRAAMERLRSEYKPRSAKPKEELKVVKKYKNGVEVVDGKFSGADEPDEYLYHVTTKERAAKIGKDGFVADKARSMGSGFYEEYSKGKVFFADRNGVSYWQGKISDHLESQTDGEAPKLVVLRVPKASVSGLEKDDLGTKDSRAGAYFVRGGVKLKSFFKSSDCGANAEGGGGFQPGNTCGRGDGSGESDGEGKASKKKPVKKGKAKGVLAWAEEKFGDSEKAKAFADWFGESKVVDEDGNPEETAPIPVYHGTTHDFEEFDLDRANVESDMGAGHYFSSDVGDSEANYAGEGPDLTSRIEQLADQLEGEFGDEYDVDEISDRLELPSDRVQEIIDGAEDDREVAKELAREKLVGGEAKVITAYLKMEKPVVLGDPKWGKEVKRAEKGETFFDFEYDEVDADGRRPDDPDFDPDTSEIQGYKGKLADLLDAVRNQAANYNEVGDGLEDDLAELQSTAADYGGFRAGELVSRLKSMESLAYATNDDGKLVSGTIVGHALRDMGFDGIVYKDAAQHFPNFGSRGDGKAIKPGTRHYVIWDSRQIKAANNQGTFDASNPNIYKSGSSCGANGPGGGGFQPGNTCGKRDGKGSESSEGGGKGASVNPKILAWAREKFGDDTTAENFAKWFGDSKVVDEAGNPLVVYHGTSAEFDTFDEDRLGQSTGHPLSKLGFYFSSEKVADRFTRDFTGAGDFADPEKLPVREGAKKLAAFVSMSNPYIISAEDFRNKLTVSDTYDDEYGFSATPKQMQAFREKLKADGYDGIIVKKNARKSPGTEEWDSENYIVFTSPQIKSATSNSGTFNPKDPNITKSAASDSYNPPESARNNARKVLRWKEQHGDAVRGMTATGWARANQLASGERLSRETVGRMAAFARHRKNSKVDPKFRDEPWRDAGYVAWLGWGGDSGINWAAGVIAGEGKSGSGCGANAEGGGGFQRGNTCGSRDGGDSEGSGGSKPGKGGKVYEWALKKFKDEETARNFTKWFGDSKVVDGDGNPLTVYHGTTGDFAEFDPRASIKSGQEFGAGIYLTTDAERAALYANDEGGSIKPLYLKAESVLDRDGELSEAQAESISRVLSEDILPEDLSYHTSTRVKRTFKDKDEARSFYQQQKQEWDSNGEGVSRYKPSVSRSTLGVDDEFIVEYSDKEKVSIMRGGRDAVSQLMRTYGNDYTFALSRAGIDAVRVGDIYVVTSPTQIKSATGNSGMFDPKDPNITKSGSGCGANAEGGGGFQRGNTCGGKKGKKDSASGKKAKKSESSSGEFVPAKTIKEAEQFALDNGLAKKVNYKKLDLELANEVNETLFKLKEKYGMAYDEIETSARKSTIVATNKADFTGGQYKGTTLKINATGFAAKAKELSYFVNKNISDQSMHIKDSDSTSEVLKKLAHHNGNETVGGGSMKATIAHEYGHLLTIPTESLDVAIRQQRLLKNLGDSSISKYAGTNGDERLAEIFALHYIDPEKVEQRHKDFFNKFSKVKI